MSGIEFHIQKSVGAHVYLLSEWGLGALKIDMSQIISYWTGKVDSVWSSTLLKICFISENALNKSCWALDFVQKCQWTHMFISPRSGARGSKDWYVSSIILHWNGKISILFRYFLCQHFWYLCYIDINIITPLIDSFAHLIDSYQ